MICSRQAARFVRNCLLIGAVLVLLIDQVGEPLLRWEYRYRGSSSNRQILDATYYGFSGRYESGVLDTPDGYPVVLFSRLEPPLWQRVTGKLRSMIP